MFKKLLITFSLVVTTNVFAETIFFACKSTAIDGVHMFDANGVVVIDDFMNADGVITVKTAKAGEEESVQVFEQIQIGGYLRHYDAGKPTKNSFDQLILKTNNPYLKSVNLVLETELPLVSNILSVDNFMYRSNCYKTQE